MSESSALRAELQGRIAAVELTVADHVLDGCLTYVELLARWNARMNLTALPLSSPIPPRTLDKLIVEPLCAVELMPSGSPHWLDLGSGGGSPAIPIRLARPSGSLAMVEARSRKCAFLREAVRVLDLARTEVRAQRFEDLQLERPADVITLRAVRLDADLAERCHTWLAPEGAVVCFGTSFGDGFVVEKQVGLPDGSAAYRLRMVDRDI